MNSNYLHNFSLLCISYKIKLALHNNAGYKLSLNMKPAIYQLASYVALYIVQFFSSSGSPLSSVR